MNCLIKTAFLLSVLSIFIGCENAPVPPEVSNVEIQEHDLWKAGAIIYAPEEYSVYKEYLRSGKDLLVKENQRFAWFRDYRSVKEQFIHISLEGDRIFQKIRNKKQTSSDNVTSKIIFFRSRIETLRKLSSLINEGRYSSRALTKAEVMLAESRILNEKGQYQQAEEKIRGVSRYTTEAIEALHPVINRYIDNPRITKWRAWVNETIEDSKKKNVLSIVVSKIDKKLMLYRSGKLYKTYEIGLGTNGSKDKLYAGDRATPEGKYRIIKKLPWSHFHKALLINYPNDDDRRQFVAARKKGLIPGKAGIGGLIEIHGGGKNGMTYGCVAMENTRIDELYGLVNIGTPVTIVGAIEYENIISTALKEL